MTIGAVSGGGNPPTISFGDECWYTSANAIIYAMRLLPLESHEFTLFNGVLVPHLWWVSRLSYSTGTHFIQLLSVFSAPDYAGLSAPKLRDSAEIPPGFP